MLSKIKEYFKSLKQVHKNLSITGDVVVCRGCRNSKVIINKDGKSYEYSYDENGKQTLEIK